MKARPCKNVSGEGYVECPIEECTHLTINIPGPTEQLTLPVILKGKREGTGAWTWNGDINKPTLRPSVLTQGSKFNEKDETVKFRCHSWINDGQAIFLDDCSHEFKNQTLELLDI